MTAKSGESANPDLLGADRAGKTLAGTDIPLLFCDVSDPVGAGLVKQIDPPDHRHISGVVYSQ